LLQWQQESTGIQITCQEQHCWRTFDKTSDVHNWDFWVHAAAAVVKPGITSDANLSNMSSFHCSQMQHVI
jgi:hypothetical protein